MKVKALRHGQHDHRVYEPGEVFEIEGKEHPIYKVDGYGNIQKDAKGEPVVDGKRPALAEWMEEVKDEPVKAPATKTFSRR